VLPLWRVSGNSRKRGPRFTRVEPQLVAEFSYLTWTGDGLLRHTVYFGLRSDKPATEVRREVPRKEYGRFQSAGDGRIAQIPVVCRRLAERVISTGPGTEGMRQSRPFLKQAANASVRPTPAIKFAPMEGGGKCQKQKNVRGLETALQSARLGRHQ
jgi:hypothetical protein